MPGRKRRKTSTRYQYESECSSDGSDESDEIGAGDGATRVTARKKKAKNSLEYDVTHRKRGQAVIFNHNKFMHAIEATRVGAQVDVAHLTKCLTKLRFQVTLCEDLKKDQLLKKLNQVAREDHREADCLLIVIMTHGHSGTLTAYDGLYEIRVLWEIFKGENCSSLIGKPKLFFIQACRGSKVDNGVVSNDCCCQALETADSLNITVPSYADFFIANASFDGYAAFRNGLTGSWFIRALCNELSKHGEKLDICEILTRVNQHVAVNNTTYAPPIPSIHLKKQMPNFFSTLTKKLYFTPKNPSRRSGRNR